jgi:hypothetical protein
MCVRRIAKLLVQIGASFVICLSGSSSIANAQQTDDDEQSRQIVLAEFLQSRPTSQKKRTTPVATTSSNASVSDLLGVTLWRLRPASSKDDIQARLLDHEGDTDSPLIAERVSSDTQFKEGQKVRLSIESPRTGYLYVIDREQYSDGTFSDPYLIFPTLKTNGGDNAVTAGRLVEIPDQNDKPIYFKMNRSRADQSAEVLTLLVSIKPIPNLQLEMKPLKLRPEQFAQWEKAWNAPTKRVELMKRVGTTYTKAEMTAGASATSLLSNNDPPPQTIYRVSSKPGDPALITISLQYEVTKKVE